MSLHWWHITIAYVLVLGIFGVLAIGAALRHRAAKRLLATLDPRASVHDDHRRHIRPGRSLRIA